MARQATRLSLNHKLQLNTQLATSIRVLRFDATGLTRYLEEQAAENPYLVLTPPAPETAVWLPRWTTAFAAQGVGHADAPDIGALLQSPTPGLIAHVTREADQIIRDPRERDIASGLIQALEPSGWLGRPLVALACEIGCSPAQAEVVLIRLQGMEPTGIFARSLGECLELQAIEAGVMDPVMRCLLKNLDLLAKGEFARLARLCDVDEAEISKRLRLIRSFDPKPGAQFGQAAAPMREPDLIAERGPNGWAISLNRSSLPELSINAPEATGKTPAALSEARALQRVVANRNQTLLQIGQQIFARQEAVLTRGLEALQPMKMQDIAKALDLHISTISRAIAGVSIDTPRGTIWLRALFTAAVGGSSGETGAPEGKASGAIRARLHQLIRAEDATAPLSDLALAEALSTDTPIARRTIAKYRALLDIPPAHRRKHRT